MINQLPTSVIYALVTVFFVTTLTILLHYYLQWLLKLYLHVMERINGLYMPHAVCTFLILQIQSRFVGMGLIMGLAVFELAQNLNDADTWGQKISQQKSRIVVLPKSCLYNYIRRSRFPFFCRTDPFEHGSQNCHQSRLHGTMKICGSPTSSVQILQKLMTDAG